jgi:hypothetical protein
MNSADTVKRSSPPAPAPVAAPAKPDSVREDLLRRKGELLMARKRILASSEMTRSQKDSALQTIEEESVELSKKMLERGH